MIIRHPPKLKLQELITENPDFLRHITNPELNTLVRVANDKYLHWDKFRYRPMPAEIHPYQAWAYLRFQRTLNQRFVPLQNKEGVPFTYWLPDKILQILSQIDRWSGETISVEQPQLLPSRERYIISMLMEEAIASSQLEGAATTRPVAKAMLLSGRKPRNHHEQMIYNNWVTIQHLRENRTMKLTPESLLEIHSMITKSTLDDPDDEGRVRTRDDIFVQYLGEVVHTPPLSHTLEQRIEQLCAFANDDDQHSWIHPVLKATMLHFWLGYDHPFVDGNGRTARALFYWYLLSRNYWLFEYLPISRYFLKAPGQYARAYLYTETDENDLTYFLVYNLRVIHASFQELHTYLGRKQRELTAAENILQKYRDLNDRQRNVIAHALRHPEAEYTVQSHKTMNSIAYDTARSDLVDLERRGVLDKVVRGKTHVFVPTQEILKSAN